MEDITKTFLDKLETLVDEKVNAYVPSFGEVKVSPLSFKQQKALISTIADGQLSSLKFQKALNDVLLANVGLDLHLRVTDKLPLILAIRVASINSTVKIGDVVYDLAPNVEACRKLKFKLEKTLNGEVKVELSVPTIKEENKVILSLIESFKGSENEISKSVGNVYTYEILKFIKSIKFGESELVFADIPIKDRVKIVDNLPLSINKKIVDFIQDIKKKEAEIQTFPDFKSFDIDVSFFDS